jgi:hypothetical protein
MGHAPAESPMQTKQTTLVTTFLLSTHQRIHKTFSITSGDDDLVVHYFLTQNVRLPIVVT